MFSSRLVLLFSFLVLVACGGGSSFGPVSDPNEETYTVSGEIRTFTGMVSDLDVNDPEAPYASNDSFSEAQFLPNPFSLGGYVNKAGDGYAGRSFASGDERDVFKLILIRDQVITLQAQDSDNTQLRLRLYLQSDTSLPVAESSGSPAVVIVPTTDEFFLEVEVIDGASAYTLTTGLSNRSSRNDRSLEFEPGKVLLKLKPSSRGGKESGSLQRMNLRLNSVRSGGVLEYELADGWQRFSLEKRQQTLQMVADVNQLPEVLYAEPDYRVKPYLLPTDNLYHYQWNYPAMNLPFAWDLETGSDSVTVALVDTGILADHPDLQENLLPGYDFVSDLDRAADGDGIDSDPNDPGLPDDPGNSAVFHGTHVAGIVAASSNNDIGVTGTAWGIRIMPLRALGAVDGSVSDVAEAIRYAAGLPNQSGQLPLKAADIINLSLGTPDYSQVLADAVTAARLAGVIIIGASGNQSTATPHYPAALPEVISVSAIDSTGLRASYSNVGPSIDLVAPGGDDEDNNADGIPDAILSTLGDATGKRSYELLKGTSMACSQVSGIVGLMESVYQRNLMDLTPTKLDEFLQAGLLTQDTGDSGFDEIYGYGVIDSYKALATAIEDVTGMQPPALSPRLAVSPTKLNFGTEDSDTIVTLSNLGSEVADFVILSVNSDQDWLEVTKMDDNSGTPEEDGLGLYQITANRQHPDLQADNLYHARVTFVSNQTGPTSTVSLDTYLQVSSDEVNQQNSYHVDLVDTESGLVVQSKTVQSLAGIYAYQFDGVKTGSYRIRSYTDVDNNKLTCDTGETCGSYPAAINLESDTTDLNISASLSLNLL